MRKMKLAFDSKKLFIGLLWEKEVNVLHIVLFPLVDIQMRIYGKKPYVLKKRGLFYREKAAGYTSDIKEAGRYTLEEARKLEYPHDEPVTKHHMKDFLA